MRQVPSTAKFSKMLTVRIAQAIFTLGLKWSPCICMQRLLAPFKGLSHKTVTATKNVFLFRFCYAYLEEKKRKFSGKD
jgi:hypothetical protein